MTPTATQQRAHMRVQLQEQRGRGPQGTIHHAAIPLFDLDGDGVTTAQVEVALIELRSHRAIPGNRRIQRQADAAFQRATRWLHQRPSNGGVNERRGWSFPFDPQRPDDTFRFDIENLVGHNLRK